MLKVCLWALNDIKFYLEFKKTPKISEKFVPEENLQSNRRLSILEVHETEDKFREAITKKAE